MPSAKARRRRTSSFGTVRKLPSGRWQARYPGPDGSYHNGPITFDTKQAADDYLAQKRVEVRGGRWVSPDAGAELFASYAPTWLAERRPLTVRTRAHYQQILDRHLIPVFGPMRLDAITPMRVNRWYRRLDTGPTMQAHAYGLLRTIMGTAVNDEVVQRNPCTIRGGGSVKRASRTEPATLAELQIIRDEMPDRLAAMIDLAAWCALRFGELAELRRRDIDLRPSREAVKITRGVVSVKIGDGQPEARVVGDPKSQAGKRTVAIPPHVVPNIAAHLAEHVEPGPDALLFPAVGGGHLATRTLYDAYYPAREAAGRPDLRFHDLRHTGATLAAQTGATLAELMNRLGHSTVSAAMKYQHASAERDREVAAKLSNAAANVTPIGAARRKRAEGST